MKLVIALIRSLINKSSHRLQVMVPTCRKKEMEAKDQWVSEVRRTRENTEGLSESLEQVLL